MSTTPDKGHRHPIACALCGLICEGMVTHSHLRAAHALTVAAYRTLGHQYTHPSYYADIGASRRGADHPYWKGGRFVFANGYVYVRHEGRYELEHRLVMSKRLGRPLRSEEVVHHLDGDRQNNADENLVLRINSTHVGEHARDRWAAGGALRKKYGERAMQQCDHCGIAYTVYPSQLRLALKHHYCGRACFAAARKRRSAELQ